MKKINLNKRINVNKYVLVKKAFVLASVLTIPFSIAGCNNQVDIQPKYEKYDISNKENFTVEDWDLFAKGVYSLLQDKSINISYEKFESALLMLNFDYIKYAEDEELKNIITNYFKESNENSIYDDSSNLNELLQAISEYNLSNKNDLFPTEKLFIPQLYLYSNSRIIDSLEKDINELKKYNNGETTDYSKEALLSIFNNAKNFESNISSIEGYLYSNLTSGGSVVVDSLVEQVSKLSTDFTTVEDRNMVRTAIDNNESFSRLENQWYAYGYYVSSSVLSNTEIDQNKILNGSLEEKCILLYKDINSKTPTTKNQIKDLFTIINFDYFMNDENNRVLFEGFYPNFDFESSFESAHYLVESINAYNSVPDANKISLSEFVIDNNNDKFSLIGFEKIIDGIYKGDKETINTNVNFLFNYSNYNEKTRIVVEDTENGTIVKLNKNVLSTGNTQVINWLTYNTVMMNKDRINNDELVNGIIELVAENNDTNIHADLVTMYYNSSKQKVY